MPRTAQSCKKCEQNAQAWEQAAIKLWEANVELLVLKDRLEAVEAELQRYQDQNCGCM